jgi:hypothetical protein
VGTFGRWKAGAALAWCALLGWIAFVRGRSVPLLSLVDLGFHELGHLVTYPLPWDGVTAAMGTVAQIGVPLGLAAYFGLRRQRDLVGAAVCLAWAGTAAHDGATYIADAPFERLPLIGGEHDWAFLLAGHLDWAAPLATAVRFGGLLAVLGGAGLALRGVLERPPVEPVEVGDHVVVWTDDEADIPTGGPQPPG